MKLIKQLIYVSTATHTFSHSDVEQLVKVAADNNCAKNLTSMLLYTGTSFMQLLEGGDQDVSDVYAKIAADSRNTGISILLDRVVSERSFPGRMLEFHTIAQATFESIYCLILTNPDDAIKKMELMTNVKTPECGGFDPDRLLFFQKTDPVDIGKVESFFEFSTELAADEVFLMRDDSQIVYVNQAACKKLGYSKQELIGKYVWQWDPLFPKEVWPEFYRDFVEKRHIHFQTQHKKKTGEVFPVDIHAHLYVEHGNNFLLAFVSDISEQARVQKELLDHKKNLEHIIEIRSKELNKTMLDLKLHKAILDNHSSVSITNINGKILYVNDLMTKVSGYSRTELIGANHRILKSGVHDDSYFSRMYQTIYAGDIWKGEICNKAKDGHFYWLDVTIVPQVDVVGQPIQFFSIRTDITERKNAQLAVEQKEEELRTILENASDGIHLVSKDGSLIDCSLSFANLLGYSKDEVLRLKIWDIDASVTQDGLARAFEREHGQAVVVVAKHTSKKGYCIDVEVTINNISLKGEKILYCSSRDITQRLKDQKEIERLAKTDGLTRLNNRRAFMARFEELLATAEQNNGSLALLFIDVDNFKRINDRIGHVAGDAVLEHVAHQLKAITQDDNIVGRLGGDEFAMVLQNVSLMVLEANIKTLLTGTQVTYNDQVIDYGLSIGVALFPAHDHCIKGLLSKADKALYAAKNQGKAKGVIYSSIP